MALMSLQILFFPQKVTVMCFDQCHSRSVGKAWMPLVFRRASVHMCV